jgi:RNA polymerase sigma factor (sigma-70 family)
MMHELDPTTCDDDSRHDQISILEHLLLAWQRTADVERFHALIMKVAPHIERIARATLRRHRIPDPAAADEVLSLVLDHLRRLPGVARGERAVAPFAPPPQELRPCASDAGEAYIIWLVRDRARDIARSRRRQACHALLFSQLDQLDAASMDQSVIARAESDVGQLDELCDRLRQAVEHLPPRERSVIELLLAGKSQAAIADTIHVCEGTVSRLRGRAIAALRDLLAD